MDAADGELTREDITNIEDVPKESILSKIEAADGELIRKDITNIEDVPKGLITHLECRLVKIGTWRYAPSEKVVISSKGIRLVTPHVKQPEKMCILDIQLKEIVRVDIHFSESLKVLFLYTVPSCGAYIRESLAMVSEPGGPYHYFNPSCNVDKLHRIITLLIDKITAESKSTIQNIFLGRELVELDFRDADRLLKTCNINVDIMFSSFNTPGYRRIYKKNPDVFTRVDITKIDDMPEGLINEFECRTIRIGTWLYNATEKTVVSSKGIRLVAPNVKRIEQYWALDIQYKEIVKMIFHFSKSLNVIFIYTMPSCGEYIRKLLDMTEMLHNKSPYYSPLSRTGEQHRRITLIMDKVSEELKSVIKGIFSEQKLEEISLADANQLLA